MKVNRQAVIAIFVLIASISFTQVAPGPAKTGTKKETVYVFVQRTDNHIKRSDAEVFQSVINDVLTYLHGKEVAIAESTPGEKNYADFATSFDTVFAKAKEAGASSVLYLTVDRPATKWLKVTIQCFDMDRKELWNEEAASGGGFTGKHGLTVTTERVHERLEKHVAQAGLPVQSKQALGTVVASHP